MPDSRDELFINKTNAKKKSFRTSSDIGAEKENGTVGTRFDVGSEMINTLAFRDINEPRSIQIIRMETSSSNSRLFYTCILVICIRTYIYRKRIGQPMNIRGI
jgi:hypothetical protein